MKYVLFLFFFFKITLKEVPLSNPKGFGYHIKMKLFVCNKNHPRLSLMKMFCSILSYCVFFSVGLRYNSSPMQLGLMQCNWVALGMPPEKSLAAIGCWVHPLSPWWEGTWLPQDFEPMGLFISLLSANQTGSWVQSSIEFLVELVSKKELLHHIPPDMIKRSILITTFPTFILHIWKHNR